MTIGTLIKTKRIALGMTLDELAEACGSSKSYMHEIEADKGKDIGFSKAIMIGIALNIPINIMAATHFRGIKNTCTDPTNDV